MANSLAEFLVDICQAGRLRTAVVGIGNTLNGDDAAGPLAVQRLARAAAGRLDGHMAIIDAGPSPEAFTGPLRRFAPQVILLVDAAELHEAPGTVRWFDWSQASGMSASTHTLPPSLVAGFLTRELGCKVALIGIQPQQLNLDGGVSEPVRAAVEQVAAALAALL